MGATGDQPNATAAAPPTVTVDELQHLVGQRFPGGSYRVAHWEHVLLYDVVERPVPTDGAVHPIGLFHVPLAACGWTYQEIFDRCRAESAEAVRAGEYRWEIFAPMYEERDYDVAGEFTAVERKQGRRGGTFDKVTFRLHLTERDSGRIVAHVTNSWLFLRSPATQAGAPAGSAGAPSLRSPATQADAPAGSAGAPPAYPHGHRDARGAGSLPDIVVTTTPADLAVGDHLPEWRLDAVSPERMRLLAAILRDPNPIHWDRAEVARRGLGDRLINQGPTNVGYVCNALLGIGGPDALRDLTVRFSANVFDGDTVVAGGVVTAVDERNGERLATCDVWLDRGDGTRAVEGTAVLSAPIATNGV
jgi:acyl dehydratase